MFSIVRSGPKILILKSNHINEVINYLQNDFDASRCNIENALENSNDDSIIILLTKKMKETIKFTDVDNILIIKGEMDTMLSHILNNKKYDLISYSRIAPRIIIMRSFGDTEKMLNAIKNDYNSQIGILNEILEENNNGTIIAFTKNSLNKSISISDFYEKSLFVEQNYATIIKDLSINDLKYLNIGLDKKDWYELHIKIYDSYGAYFLHYQRLVKIIEKLELGLILGEDWGKDAATIFYSVEIYRIRLFTFYDPIYIKKILLGLEYLDDGTRIVDFDLYYKRKKLHSSDLRNKEMNDKIALSKKFRKEIQANLETTALKEMYNFEKQILSTRY